MKENTQNALLLVLELHWILNIDIKESGIADFHWLFGEVYGSDLVSYESIRSWRRTFLPEMQQNITGIWLYRQGKLNVSKVREIIDTLKHDLLFCQNC